MKLNLFTSFVLFFISFSSGIAVGMLTDVYPVGSNIAEKEAQWLRTVGIRPEIIGSKDVPRLPADVQSVIFTKVVRLILDEAEDNPALLLSREEPENILNRLGRYVTGAPLEWYTSANNIDFIIKLIITGANPNTKSYKGNTILHLLIANLPHRWGTINDQYIEPIALKIKLLFRYGININAQNASGNTIAHELIKLYVESETYSSIYRLIQFLAVLGLDITSTKNNDQQTPVELGQTLVDSKINKLVVIDPSFFLEIQSWMKLLLLMDKRTKNIYGTMTWKAIENRVKQTVNPAGVEPVLNEIRRILNYPKFMAAE
jgi:hypothetical protein